MLHALMFLLRKVPGRPVLGRPVGLAHRILYQSPARHRNPNGLSP